MASEHVEKQMASEDRELLQMLKDVTVDCEGPNEYLYRFEGKWIMKDKK